MEFYLEVPLVGLAKMKPFGNTCTGSGRGKQALSAPLGGGFFDMFSLGGSLVIVFRVV